MINPTEKVGIEVAYRDKATKQLIAASDKRVSQYKKESAAHVKSQQHMVKAVERNIQAQHKMRISTRKWSDLMGKLQHKIGVVRNALLVFFFAVRPLQRAFGALTEAARQQELAETKLALALMGSGMATHAQRKELEKYAGELQKTTIYGDEQIINVQAMLATFKMNSDQIKEVTPRVLDMARGIQKLTGSQVDLQDIAKAVAKGLNGDIGSLTRYGVVLSDSVKKSKDFNKILEEIDKNYKGMSKAQMNYVDQSAQLANAWSDLKEALGEFLTKSPMVVGTLTLLKDIMSDLETNIDNAKNAQKHFNTTWSAGMHWISAVAIISKGIIFELGDSFMHLYDAASVAYGIMKLWDNRAKLMRNTENKQNINTAKGMKRNVKEYVALLEEGKKQANSIADALDRIKARGTPDIKETIDQIDAVFTKFQINTNKAAEEMKKLFTKDIPQAIATSEDRLLEMGVVWTNIATRTSTGMHGSFSHLFFDMMKRDMDDLSDYMAEFGNVLLKILSEVIAKMMVVKMFPKMGSYLGVVPARVPTPGSGGVGVGNPGITGEGWGIGSTGHRGGVLRSSGKIFDSGGVVPATLLSGEGVLSRSGMRNLGEDNLSKLNQGQSIDSNEQKQVIVVIQAWDTSDVMRNMKTITNAIAQNMQNNGTMRKAVQQYG